MGKGTSLDFKSQNLIVAKGGFIGASTYNLGERGDIKLEVTDSIVVDGTNTVSSVLSSSIITASFGGGNAGNLILDANKIEIIAGGNITSSVFGSGKGGDITVNAAESMTIKGVDNNTFNPSLISSISFNIGDAGNLTINTARLKLQDGGRIDSTTFAGGNAGNLSLNASESVEVTGAFLNPYIPSSINSAAIVNPVPIIREVFNLPDIPSGDAGSLRIVTPQLKITDSAQITVQNDGLGDAGNLDIYADAIFLKTGGGITASTQSGNGGNINLEVSDLLMLRDTSSISAEAQQAGNGGNILMDTNAIALLARSLINANAFKGDGGNINITTQGLFVSPNSQISASSQFGLDGNVEVENINGDRKFSFNQLPEDIKDSTNLVTASCNTNNQNTFALIGNGGIPDSPYQTQSLSTTWQDLRPLKHHQTTTVSISQTLTEANSIIINAQGKLELVASTFQSFHSGIISNCQN